MCYNLKGSPAVDFIEASHLIYNNLLSGLDPIKSIVEQTFYAKNIYIKLIVGIVNDYRRGRVSFDNMVNLIFSIDGIEVSQSILDGIEEDEMKFNLLMEGEDSDLYVMATRIYNRLTKKKYSILLSQGGSYGKIYNGLENSN